MERLTTKYMEYSVPKDACTINRLGEADDCMSCKEVCEECNETCDICCIQKCLNKLADYEDAEEQGLLLRLQVAIGSIVYRINEYADEPFIPMGVTSIEIKGITDTFKEMKCKECVYGGEFTYRFSDIGKIVFLTKEEAEQALAEMKGV